MTEFIKKKTKLWLRAVVAAIISGASNNILASAGLGAAGWVGIKVEPLTVDQMGALMFAGAVVGVAAFLVKSPLPPCNGHTEFFKKDSADIPSDPPQYPRK